MFDKMNAGKNNREQQPFAGRGFHPYKNAPEPLLHCHRTLRSGRAETALRKHTYNRHEMQFLKEINWFFVSALLFLVSRTTHKITSISILHFAIRNTGMNDFLVK